MKSRITITDINNINWKTRSVIEGTEITEETHDSDMDVFLFEDIDSGRQRRGTLIGVSLMRDLIVRDDKKFKILHMLTT